MTLSCLLSSPSYSSPSVPLELSVDPVFMISLKRWLCCLEMNSTTFSTSASGVHADWILMRELEAGGLKSMSPLPKRPSAPLVPKIVMESMYEPTWKAIRVGKLALIIPVMTFVLGLCVARTRWMPTARAFAASMETEFSISPFVFLLLMRSANSSMIITVMGSLSGIELPFLSSVGSFGFFVRLLKSARFRTLTAASRS